MYGMPVSDVSIATGKKLFDVNFWSIFATTQAFLPLLLQSNYRAMVVNNTSIASVAYVPFQSVYNASKAAAAMLTQTMRLELAPLHIRVCELKTGRVQSNIFDNAPLNSSAAVLLPNSLYAAAKDSIEMAMDGGQILRNPDDPPQDATDWAREVVKVLEDPNAPSIILKGKNADLSLPGTLLSLEIEEIAKFMSGINEFEKELKAEN